jgi:hypothetical protein
VLAGGLAATTGLAIWRGLMRHDQAVNYILYCKIPPLQQRLYGQTKGKPNRGQIFLPRLLLCAEALLAFGVCFERKEKVVVADVVVGRDGPGWESVSPVCLSIAPALSQNLSHPQLPRQNAQQRVGRPKFDEQLRVRQRVCCGGWGQGRERLISNAAAPHSLHNRSETICGVMGA